MSRYVAALVYRKKVGSMARKAILAYCAERANDNGGGIWSSKVTIAKEVECAKKTVIETFNAFVEEGVLILVGKKKIQNGFVHVYDMNLDAILAMPDALLDEELRGVILNPSPGVTPRGNPELPQEVTLSDPNRPKTVLKPSIARKRDGDLFGEGEPKASKQSPDEHFETFWEAFPKKAGKPAAKKAFGKALKSGADPAKITEAARRYAQTDAVQRGFVKYPQGWLNDERWKDADLQESETGRRRSLETPDWMGGVSL